jgi:O-acetylhomoserine/O-acetylserine sulfhydrylase-like pyridoxal-dependent enzyme
LMVAISTGRPVASSRACTFFEFSSLNPGTDDLRTEPADGYHGMRFWETYGLKALSAKVRMDAMRDLGPCISPFNSCRAWKRLR